MTALHQILSASRMQAAEQQLINDGTSVETLMERAGSGAADWVNRIAAGRQVTVLCGPGNNGGDGYVIARVLAQRGVAVQLVAPMAPATDAAIAARQKWGGAPVSHAAGDVLVDCLFGTGLSRPLSDDLCKLLKKLAGAHRHVVAVDLPSGVNSDTGELLNEGLPDCACTLTLGAWKYAHWLMPSAAKMGQRYLVDIGVEDCSQSAQLSQVPHVMSPSAKAHKYTRGMALVVGGEMMGAAVMASSAARFAGAGYVKLASSQTPPSLPADVVHSDGNLEETLTDSRVGAVLIGPGLGRDERARRNLKTVFQQRRRMVVDADALALMAPEILPADPSSTLCTPHEGELALMCAAFGIEEHGKLDRAAALHSATGMTILAKGADNVLVGNGGEVRLFRPAASWLSTAGTGDVLAGIAVSRLATGEKPFTAAEQAVHIHAEAARRAGPAFSATTLVDHVAQAYARFL